MNNKLATKLEQLEDSNAAICRKVHEALHSPTNSKKILRDIYEDLELQSADIADIIDLLESTK